MVPDGARVAIDLGVVDSSGSRRRIQMSTSQREIAVTPLNARVPLSGVIIGQVISHTCFCSSIENIFILYCVYKNNNLHNKINAYSTTWVQRRLSLFTSLTIFFMFPSQWVNLCIDLGSLVSGLFKAQSYKSLEGVSIGGSCIIRRVFTLKSSPPDTTGTELSPPFEEIPRAYQMPTSVATAQTQVHVHAACIHVAWCVWFSPLDTTYRAFLEVYCMYC